MVSKSLPRFVKPLAINKVNEDEVINIEASSPYKMCSCKVELGQT
jgi:hypothetical protein